MPKKTKNNSSGLSSNKSDNSASKRERKDLVPVTAIGASAGGLDPIEQFFDAMPADSGCAFVVIQHLSPDFRSLMDELLARHSTMPIHRIVDGMEVRPNTIYLNMPRTVMTLSGNNLVVKELDETESVYLPIDMFFQSMAEERRENAIGLVLSGTGSDGTRGSLKINLAGGKVLVQDPETTRFDGMPRSVLADGYSTMFAAPHVLAESVIRLLKNEPLSGLDASVRLPIVDPLSDVLSMLKHTHGTDFLQYKEATVHRRIERRAQMRGLTEIDDYRDLLSIDAAELQDLYADLLIEVTEFFRDPDAFEILKTLVIPDLLENLQENASLRVWVPGCASGEEAYSIAILLQEQARAMGFNVKLKIMATDIHVRSMSQASSGIYNETALANMPADWINRYFDRADGQAQIKPSLRNMVFFSTHDVTRDPPFTRIDLISCRNLLIYLKEVAQEKVMRLLHFSLRKDGYLFLGPSEHIGAIAHEFAAVNEKWRIYKKKRDVKLLESEPFFQQAPAVTSIARANSINRNSPRYARMNTDDTIPFKRAQKAALETIVSQYAPPGFLLAEDGVVAHIFGNAGELIPLQSGSFSKRIVDLIRPELKAIVTAALDSAKHQQFTSFKRAAYVKDDETKATTYEVSLIPLELPGESTQFQLLSIEKAKAVSDDSNQSVVVSVENMAAFDSSQELQKRIAILEHNLQSSEESLQSTIEELETSNEELQSTNEELMSTNEELQSTNEELHSVNEELYTVSAEHQRKNDDLTERETDIDVLLQSSKIGTVHLDENLRLRRYTNNARSVFNILPQDIGRPIEHITLRATDQDIPKLIQVTNQFRETHEVQIKVDDNSYLLRIMPYKADEADPSGVLITVIDITDVENVRSSLNSLNTQYKDLVENTDSFFVRWDAKTDKILFCNEVYAARWDTTSEELIGKSIVELRNVVDRDTFRETLLQYEPNKSKEIVVTSLAPDGRERADRISTRAISHDGETIDEYQSNGYDITGEYGYRIAVDKLMVVFANDELNIHQKVEQLLRVGLDFYDLDTAIVSMISGDHYEIAYVQSLGDTKISSGLSLRLEDTICGQFVESKQLLLIDDVSKSELNGLPCHLNSGVQCYVGATVQTVNGPFGTVSFRSSKPRNKPFNVQHENFTLFISSWVGFLLGSHEQMEFMAHQNQYYQGLFRSVPTMMFLCDADGLIISASDRLCTTLEIDPLTMPGRNCHKLLNIDDVDGLKDVLASDATHKRPFTLTLANGSTIDVEINSRIKSVGSLHGVRMVVLNDVSERNLVSRNLEEQNRRLEIANENLNQFAFIASHDLQEPLRKIQQFSSFLEEDLKDILTDDTRYHLNVVVDASDRMSTLIHDLLRFSGATQDQPTKESVFLTSIVEEVLSDLAGLIKEAGATIELEVLPTVSGDKAMLRQLFANLIGNCIKYRTNDRPLSITIAPLGLDLKGGVTVVDNGIGFEMEFAKRIFEPFNRLHRNKEYKGNGIGLAICSTVCDKHGWKISAESEPGVGSIFTINFQQEIENDSRKT